MADIGEDDSVVDVGDVGILSSGKCNKGGIN